MSRPPALAQSRLRDSRWWPDAPGVSSSRIASPSGHGAVQTRGVARRSSPTGAPTSPFAVGFGPLPLDTSGAQCHRPRMHLQYGVRRTLTEGIDRAEDRLLVAAF